jgi:hypothetical protein
LFGAAGGPWTAVKESVHHYVLVDASMTRVRLTAYRLDGSVLDTCELDPRANDRATAAIARAALPSSGGGGCAMIFTGYGRGGARGAALFDASTPFAGLAFVRIAQRRRGRRSHAP